MRNTIHSLVKQGMETWSMIHLLQMSEFVVYDEVLQMRRQEHEIEAQVVRWMETLRGVRPRCEAKASRRGISILLARLLRLSSTTWVSHC